VLRRRVPRSWAWVPLMKRGIREIYSFTARTLETQYPVPFGAMIVNTKNR